MTIDTNRGIAGLKGALRYVRAYRDHVFVVKLGGEVLKDDHALDGVAAQVSLLHSLGIRIVVVHGGGPQATALSRRLGVEPRIVAGRRVTDDAALDVAKMVYAGTLNVAVLAALRRHQLQAIGLSGVDGELITARKRPPVTVVDDSGAVIGTGTLAASDPSSWGPQDAVYAFVVTVPAGQPRYGIEIGRNRGTEWFTEGQMRKGPSLSLSG